MAVPGVHLTWCWRIDGKCLLFGGKSKRSSLRSFSDFHQHSVSTVFKECMHGYIVDCGEGKKKQVKVLKDQISLTYQVSGTQKVVHKMISIHEACFVQERTHDEEQTYLLPLHGCGYIICGAQCKMKMQSPLEELQCSVKPSVGFCQVQGTV